MMLLATSLSQQEMVGWVVIALGVIVGLFFTVCKPMVETQKTMTELTCAIREFNNRLIALEGNNTESHRRLFGELEKHTNELQNHETRIHDLEMKNN